MSFQVVHECGSTITPSMTFSYLFQDIRDDAIALEKVVMDQDLKASLQFIVCFSTLKGAEAAKWLAEKPLDRFDQLRKWDPKSKWMVAQPFLDSETLWKLVPLASIIRGLAPLDRGDGVCMCGCACPTAARGVEPPDGTATFFRRCVLIFPW